MVFSEGSVRSLLYMQKSFYVFAINRIIFILYSILHAYVRVLLCKNLNKIRAPVEKIVKLNPLITPKIKFHKIFF
jgi:hypothetical protein